MDKNIITNQDGVEEVKEDVLLPEAEPKTIVMTVGINGIPSLNVQCDREISVRDIATAMATMDVLNFNNYLTKDNENPMEAVRNFTMFQTLRKEIFINSVSKLIKDPKLIEFLAEI